MISLYLSSISNSDFLPGIAHKGTWKSLQVESCALRERGLTQGTWANRVSHLRQFLLFTTYFGVQDFPVHLGVLLRFIAFLGRTPLAYKYASSIVGSVKWFASLLDPAAAKYSSQF